VLLLFSILAAWGDLEGGGSHGEGRGGCQWGGEEEREGAAATNWGEGGGGSHPSDRNQWPKLALSFELPTPVEKLAKDLLFPEECLLKLQTPMPQNKKEKRKKKFNFFSENWGITEHYQVPLLVWYFETVLPRGSLRLLAAENLSPLEKLQELLSYSPSHQL
jgi:hypothetical protein